LCSATQSARASVSEISTIMDAETWFTPKEAIAAGFADTITTPDEDDADVAASVDLSHFRRVPAQIAARFSRFSSDDDGAVRRERIERNRTLEFHKMDMADSRRHTMAMNELELSKMRAEDTPDAQRRRTMAQHAAELAPGGWIGRLRDPDPDTVRRRTMAAHARELRAMAEREPAPSFNVVVFH